MPRTASPAPRSEQARAIEAYLRAKDENRPFLIAEAFDAAATLEIVVNSGGISFPPSAQGRDAIAQALVRDFGAAFENVRTLCLARPPGRDRDACSCRWLVGMSSKADRTVRVGAGRYVWRFRPQSPRLAGHLTIVIEAMQVLASAALPAVTEWLFALPYPWCPAWRAFSAVPPLEGLEPLRAWARATGGPRARAPRRRGG